MVSLFFLGMPPYPKKMKPPLILSPEVKDVIHPKPCKATTSCTKNLVHWQTSADIPVYLKNLLEIVIKNPWKQRSVFWDTWAFQIDFLIIKLANRFLSRLHGYKSKFESEIYIFPIQKWTYFVRYLAPGCVTSGSWAPAPPTKPSGAWEAARSNKRRFTPPGSRSRSV